MRASACVEHRCEVTTPSIHCGYPHITIFSPLSFFLFIPFSLSTHFHPTSSHGRSVQVGCCRTLGMLQHRTRAVCHGGGEGRRECCTLASSTGLLFSHTKKKYSSSFFFFLMPVLCGAQSSSARQHHRTAVSACPQPCWCAAGSNKAAAASPLLPPPVFFPSCSVLRTAA